MANNRMYLVNRKTGARLCLAKYYPSLGWFTTNPEAFGASLNKTFNDSDFGHLTPDEQVEKQAQPGLSQPYANYDPAHLDRGDEWELEYECRSEPSPNVTGTN